jgi:hypothetical protein
MSQLEVDKVIPQSGTTLTLGENGDTVSVPSGATLDASNATLTLPDDSVTTAKIVDANVTTAKLADANITTAKLAYDPNPFRNIVINGDMQIAQRSTSVASITTTGYYTADRFQTAISNLGTWTQSQSTDVPTGQGFATSLKLDCTTADATPSPNDVLSLTQKFEGQNLQYLKKGTANAVSLTASFWVKSTKTGTFICELRDTDNNRTISKSYTVNVTNTWEKKTITFEGDTTGAFTNDNGNSLDLNFYLGSGTTYTSGTLQTTWDTRVNANRAVGQVNIADSTSNDFYLTGVQLEAGTTASDFEFLPIDVNLARCLRYFEKLYSLTTAPADGATNYTSGGAAGEASWTCFTTNNIGSGTKFKVEKRTTPTVTLFRGAATGTAGVPGYYNDSDAWADATSPTVTVNDSVGFFIRSAVTSTRGRSYLFEGGWTASAEL